MFQPKSKQDEPDLINQMFFTGLFYALIGYPGEANTHFQRSVAYYKIKRDSFWFGYDVY